MSERTLSRADYGQVRDHLKSRLPRGRKPSNRRYRNAIFWSVRQVLGDAITEAEALSAYKAAYARAKEDASGAGQEGTWPGTFPGSG